MKPYYGIIFLISFGSTAYAQMTLDQLKNGIGGLYGIVENNNLNVANQQQQQQQISFLDVIGDYDTQLKGKFRESFVGKTAYYLAEQSNIPNHNYFNDFDQNYINLQMLTMSLGAFLRKKYYYQSNPIDELKKIRVVELFDDLLALRLQCADYLQKEKQIESKNLIVDFSPLAVSRWNPFYWGNWYDRLHRKVATLPPLPWNENNPDDTNKALMESHISVIENIISRINNVTTQKAILQIYVLTMRELRILVKQNITTKGRNRLRWLGGAGFLTGLGLAARYFIGGKKQVAEQQSSTKVNETEEPAEELTGDDGQEK